MDVEGRRNRLRSPAHVNQTGHDVTADCFNSGKTEYYPETGLDPGKGQEDNDALVERIGNAMMQDGQFDRAQADAFAASSRFTRHSVHLLGYWKSLLAGVACKTLGGTTSSHELEWRYISSPTALFGRKVRLISEHEFYDRHAEGKPVGGMEWAHISTRKPGAEVILFLLSGPSDQQDFHIFANDPAAASVIHTAAVAGRLAMRGQSRPALMPLDVSAPLHFVKGSIPRVRTIRPTKLPRSLLVSSGMEIVVRGQPGADMI